MKEDYTFQLTKDDNIDSQNTLNYLNNQEDIPEGTKWEVCCRCFGDLFSPFIKIKTDKSERCFWGYIEFDPCMPIFVSFLLIFVHAAFFIFPFQFIKSKMVCFLTVTIFLSLFLWSYFFAACSDPGFLPYNWVQTKKFKYSWKEQLTGLAINNEQIEYARLHRPSFASFSKSAGRFVIRADHICGWINNWVGKRNHKHFLLMNFWGFIFCFNLFGWTMVGSDSILSRGPFSAMLQFMVIGLEVIFGASLTFVFFDSIHDLVVDVTRIKKWKNQNNNKNGDELKHLIEDENGEKYEKYKIGCMNSMREVCGEGSFLCWILPIEAFGDDLSINEDDFPVQASSATY
ncbi:DHHC zinc finger domain containing protein [Tritrichomonas foetus]|uniref:Palmitoyltransferase n=1 Tax=Tritrichomonas foetus TaxID=1144522 RepID=A0A1J4J6Z4_9EUKA|nr:DHHC zinc finger domain containing protein [Tritrichomonas foetus]|eukprot:OHS93967.1 DHHC zinc finger domain containing protein [Tritrichomonas foetus]